MFILCIYTITVFLSVSFVLQEKRGGGGGEFSKFLKKKGGVHSDFSNKKGGAIKMVNGGYHLFS